MNGVLNMLGLCARARRLVTGEKAVIQAVRAGQCQAVVLDGAASKNAEKAVTQLPNPRPPSRNPSDESEDAL